MPGSTPHSNLPTHPVPEVGSAFDIIVIGGGVLGTAFATTFGKQDKRILLLERDLSEPDRIVGELLQPGGIEALKELGLSGRNSYNGSFPPHGLLIVIRKGSTRFHRGDIQSSLAPKMSLCRIQKTPPRASLSKAVRFTTVDSFRASELLHRKLQIVEATVNDIVFDQDGVRATGVRCTLKKDYGSPTNEHLTDRELVASHIGSVSTEYRAPIVVVADGCFSKFRKQFIPKSIETASYFAGLILENAPLPSPNHGHVVLATPSPILMYQISKTETRILVDIPSKNLPSAATGALRSYLEASVCPQLPEGVRPAFLRAIQDDASGGRRIRTMPNNFLPPSTSSELGIVLLGDAMNMRHPLTGGGMTVALNDVVYLRDLLKGDATADQEVTMVQLELFFWKRKELSTIVNVLAQALHTLFSGQVKTKWY
ncbi:Squalene epoxidase [Podila humilis]|nr:Squalene epoxidase [Podila humilis]